jgi:hypothetical protein
MNGIARTLDAMAAHDVDVLLLGREGNARFVSGAQRLYLAGARAFAPGCIVVRDTRAVHLLSVGDSGIPADIPRANLYPITWNPGALVAHIATLPGVHGARRIGVDGITPLFEQLVGAFFADAQLVDGEVLLRDVRCVKTDAEIDAIRAAITVAELVMASALEQARAGANDSAIVGAAMSVMAREGVTTAAFEPVVTDVDGLRAIDVAVLRRGWEGGFARAVDATEGVASRAHADAIASCVAGASVHDIDARVHGVGNGYEVLAPDDILQHNMVLSVATSAMRDMVRVTNDAPNVLTTFTYS